MSIVLLVHNERNFLKHTWTTGPSESLKSCRNTFSQQHKVGTLNAVRLFVVGSHVRNSLSRILFASPSTPLKHLVKDRVTYYPGTFCKVLKKNTSVRWDPPSCWKSWNSLIVCPSCFLLNEHWFLIHSIPFTLICQYLSLFISIF